MAQSLNQLTDETLLYLSGFTGFQGQATHLTQNITSTETIIKVADTSAVTRGLVEIGDELLWVDSVDTGSGSMLVPPYGRGYRGSESDYHYSGERVAMSPQYPRLTVKNAIKETFLAVRSSLFTTQQVTFNYDANIVGYALPASTRDVIKVVWRKPTSTHDEWTPISRYRKDLSIINGSNTGVNLNILEPLPAGSEILVLVSKEPSVPADDDDPIDTNGFPESATDILRLGASYRLLPMADAGNLNTMSAQSDFAADRRGATTGASLARLVYTLYQTRLDEEVKKLQNDYPVRLHFTI